MKLLVKTTLFYLLISLLVFGIGAGITFNIFAEEIDLELDRYLRQELNETIAQMEEGVPYTLLIHNNFSIKPLAEIVADDARPLLSDTTVFHPYLKRMETNRKAVYTKTIAGTSYRFETFDVIVEEDDISDSVYSALTKMFALLAVIVVLGSVVFSQYLFKPFNQTLRQIQSFRIQDPRPIPFHKAHTKEFTSLNRFVNQMTEKAQQDYLNLKEFTENASHEMQTPLAIAKGKLELLLESENLEENQVKLIGSAHLAISKLSKLGRSLALLSKIENLEFHDHKDIDLSQAAEDTIVGFQELIELKQIGLKRSIEPNVHVKVDPSLADILLTNLLQNAIRHNIEGGIIEIHLDKASLYMKNTGQAPAFPTDQLFERFKKDQQSSESIGLGLAIVKKICEVNNWKIHYHYAENWHEVSVDFGPKT